MAHLLHSPLTIFIAQAIVILAFSRLVGLLCRKLGQPMVIAEVAAGILLGPSFLGLFFPEAKETLFPASSMPNLYMFSQVGLIFFMFLIGLELDPNLLRGRGHASVAISHTSIIVPFALGSGLALYLYPKLSDPTVKFSSFALFMGIAMSITAFPVLARILAERRLLKTHIGAVTIACAAVDDVTAWCILAFVVSIVRAHGVLDAVWTTTWALIYIVGMFAVVRPFLARMAERGVSVEGMTQNVVAVAFLLVLLSSGVTEWIGIHALFGAFLLGAITPRKGGYAQALAAKIEDFVVVFMLPLFFAYSGLRTQINLLDSGETWVLCGMIIFVACLGKFGGSVVAARLTGLNMRESCALGVLMNTRGLMELIVLNIGLDLGVISPLLFTMMVLMALVTTFMTTPLLQWIYPQAAPSLQPTKAFAQPAASSPGRVLSILLCVADGRSGPALAAFAAALTSKEEAPSRVLALHLSKPLERTSTYIGQESPDADDPGTEALEPLLNRASILELEVAPISYVSASPAEEIWRVAADNKADLAVLACHKSLLNQRLLGGVVFQVMEQAPCDVAALIDRGLSKVERVLVPFQGSPHDHAALKLARRLKTASGAEVTILHVIPPERSGQDPRLGAQDQVESVFNKTEPAGRGGVVMKVVPHTQPMEAALEEARNGYDLIVIGVGKEWGLQRSQFGFFSEAMIRHSPTSLVVVRRGGEGT